MIKGTGSLITNVDEEGNDLPFLTTEQILRQLMKFGFYIFYDVKENLPNETFNYLAKLYDLGYDKITRIALETIDETGTKIWRPTEIVMKSYMDNSDLLVYQCKVTRKAFNQKLTANSIMNITHEEGMDWDWLSYIANIKDILDENLKENKFDTGKSNSFIAENVPSNDDVIDLSDIDNSGFAEYVDEDNDESEIVNEEPTEQFTEVGDGTE